MAISRGVWGFGPASAVGSSWTKAISASHGTSPPRSSDRAWKPIDRASRPEKRSTASPARCAALPGALNHMAFQVVALGTGQVQWPAVLSAAAKSGVKHYFIEDESPSVVEQVPQTLKFLGAVKF